MRIVERVSAETHNDLRDMVRAVRLERDSLARTITQQQGEIAELRAERDAARVDATYASEVTRESILSYLRNKAKGLIATGYVLINAADELEDDSSRLPDMLRYAREATAEAIANWLEHRSPASVPYPELMSRCAAEILANAWRAKETT